MHLDMGDHMINDKIGWHYQKHGGSNWIYALQLTTTHTGLNISKMLLHPYQVLDLYWILVNHTMFRLYHAVLLRVQSSRRNNSQPIGNLKQCIPMNVIQTRQGYSLSAGVLIIVCYIHDNPVQDIHCTDHYLGSQRA